MRGISYQYKSNIYVENMPKYMKTKFVGMKNWQKQSHCNFNIFLLETRRSKLAKNKAINKLNN